MRGNPRPWVGPAILAVVLACATNAALSALRIPHDVALESLIAVAIVAAGVRR